MWLAAAEKTEIFEKFCIGRSEDFGVTVAKADQLRVPCLFPFPPLDRG
jgi:hypothetical protein